MKQKINLWLVVCIFTFAAVGCSSESNEIITSDLPEMNDVDNCNTLKELENFNKSLTQTSPSTRGWLDDVGTFLSATVDVAAADIIGVATGIQAGQTIGGLVGLATGGTGYVVFIAATGSIVGASTSSKACNTYTTSTVKKLPKSDSEFLEIAENVYSSNLLGSEKKKYDYDSVFSMIEIPHEYRHLKRIGEDHNRIIKTANKIVETGNSGNNSLPVDLNGAILPVNMSYNDFNTTIVNNDLFQRYYKKIAKNIELCLDENGLNVDEFFKVNPLGSKRLESALKQYLAIFKTYPKSINDISTIANRYIQIIEDNDEFAAWEREMMYASLITSLYSTVLWNEFE